MPKVEMNPTSPQSVQRPSQTQEGLHHWYYLNGEKKSYPSFMLDPQRTTREVQEHFLSMVKYAQYLKTPEGRKDAEINKMREFARLHPPSFARKAFNVALQVVAVFLWVIFIKRELKGSRFFQ